MHRLACVVLAAVSTFLSTSLRSAAHATPIYGPATLLSELSGFSDSASITHLSLDGKTVILQAQTTSDRYDLFSATRPSVGSPFTTPGQNEFVDVNTLGFNVAHGAVSANGLELFFHVGDNRFGSSGFSLATRPDTSSNFVLDGLVSESFVASDRFHRPDWISPDGLRVYYNVSHTGVSDLYVQWHTSRVPC